MSANPTASSGSLYGYSPIVGAMGTMKREYDAHESAVHQVSQFDPRSYNAAPAMAYGEGIGASGYYYTTIPATAPTSSRKRKADDVDYTPSATPHYTLGASPQDYSNTSGVEPTSVSQEAGPSQARSCSRSNSAERPAKKAKKSQRSKPKKNEVVPDLPDGLLSEMALAAGFTDCYQHAVAHVNRPAEIRWEEWRERKKIHKYRSKGPARPENEFFLFSRAYKDFIMEKFGVENRKSIMKISGEYWSRHTVEFKRKYKKLAALDTQHHKDAFPGWKYNPSSKNKKSRASSRKSEKFEEPGAKAAKGQGSTKTSAKSLTTDATAGIRVTRSKSKAPKSKAWTEDVVEQAFNEHQLQHQYQQPLMAKAHTSPPVWNIYQGHQPADIESHSTYPESGLYGDVSHVFTTDHTVYDGLRQVFPSQPPYAENHHGQFQAVFQTQFIATNSGDIQSTGRTLSSIAHGQHTDKANPDTSHSLDAIDPALLLPKETTNEVNESTDNVNEPTNIVFEGYRVAFQGQLQPASVERSRTETIMSSWELDNQYLRGTAGDWEEEEFNEASELDWDIRRTAEAQLIHEQYET